MRPTRRYSCSAIDSDAINSADTPLLMLVLADSEALIEAECCCLLVLADYQKLIEDRHAKLLMLVLADSDALIEQIRCYSCLCWLTRCLIEADTLLLMLAGLIDLH